MTFEGFLNEVAIPFRTGFVSEKYQLSFFVAEIRRNPFQNRVRFRVSIRLVSVSLRLSQSLSEQGSFQRGSIILKDNYHESQSLSEQGSFQR